MRALPPESRRGVRGVVHAPERGQARHARDPLVLRPGSCARCWRARRDRAGRPQALEGDRKSTRLNSSHITISYAVFCLKKKTTTKNIEVMTKKLINTL